MSLLSYCSYQYVFTLLAVFAVTRYILLKCYHKYYKLPPGSVGLPFIGSLLSMIIKQDQFYIDLARSSKCKVCTIPVGMTNVICINDHKLAKQLLKKDCLLFRPKNIYIVNPQKLADISIINGSDWHDRRKWFQTHLMSRLNKTFVNDTLTDIMQKYIFKELDNNNIENNGYWRFKADIFHAMFNDIYNCVYGGYVEKDDADLFDHNEAVNKSLEMLSFEIILYFLIGERMATFIRNNLFYFSRPWYNKRWEITRKWAKQAYQKYDENNQITYFDNMFHSLSKKFDCESDKDSALLFDKVMTQQVIADLESMVGAGYETTSNTLEYAIAVSAKYPNIQNDIYKEIDEIMDKKNGNIELDVFGKLNKLHKLKAFVHECLRLMPVVPTSIHRQLRTANGNGLIVKVSENEEYIIPNNSIIIPNIIGMQQDPKRFENPDKFDMYRWLTGDGKFSTLKYGDIFNFTYGQRDCPGKPLAMKSMYLMIASLFCKYQFYYDNPDHVTIGFKLAFTYHVYPEIACKFNKR